MVPGSQRGSKEAEKEERLITDAKPWEKTQTDITLSKGPQKEETTVLERTA